MDVSLIEQPQLQISRGISPLVLWPINDMDSVRATNPVEQCPLLAQSGHPDALNQCPLLGGPKRTFGPEDCCHAK